MSSNINCMSSKKSASNRLNKSTKKTQIIDYKLKVIEHKLLQIIHPNKCKSTKKKKKSTKHAVIESKIPAIDKKPGLSRELYVAHLHTYIQKSLKKYFHIFVLMTGLGYEHRLLCLISRHATTY